MDEGWAYPSMRSRKYHYFRGDRSLCGKWMDFVGELEPDGDNNPAPGGPDDCKACARKRIKELDEQD